MIVQRPKGLYCKKQRRSYKHGRQQETCIGLKLNGMHWSLGIVRLLVATLRTELTRIQDGKYTTVDPGLRVFMLY